MPTELITQRAVFSSSKALQDELLQRIFPLLLANTMQRIYIHWQRFSLVMEMTHDLSECYIHINLLLRPKAQRFNQDVELELPDCWVYRVHMKPRPSLSVGYVT